MSRIEKRKYERIALKHQPKGVLALRIGDHRASVAQVKDVSSFGVNVVVGEDVPERTRITVEYADDTLQLDVYGMVAWRAQGKPGRTDIDPGSYILGIELFSPTLLTAVLGAA